MSKQSNSRWARGLAVLLMAGTVPACFHGSRGTAGGGPGSGIGLNLTHLTVNVGANSALVEWDSDLEADGRVDFGFAQPYTRVSLGLEDVTHHRVLLTGLVPGTQYHFNASSTTRLGDSAEFGDSTFATLSVPSLTPDDFNSFNLNRGLWSYLDPHDRGQLRMRGAGSSEAMVELEVPETQVYDPNAGQLRLSQAIQNVALADWEVKFQNRFDVVDAEGGMFVEAVAGTFMTFGFRFDGTHLTLKAERYAAGTLAQSDSVDVQSGPWDNEAGLWLRLLHVGPDYAALYSTDGQNWAAGPQLEFPLAAFTAGLYVGNGPASDAAFVLKTDYVFDRAFPIVEEDFGVPDDTQAPYVYRWKLDVISDSAARLRWWSDERSGGAVRWGLTQEYLSGIDFVETYEYINEGFMSGLDPASEYHAQGQVVDDLGHVETLPDVTFFTNGYGSSVPAIRVWNGWQDEALHYNYQVFGENGNPQDRVNIVGRIFDEDEDRIALTNTLEWSLNGAEFVQTLLGDDRSIDTAPWRLSDEGDFNIVIPVTALTGGRLIEGYHRNELLLRASDDDGHEVYRMVIVQFKPDTSWPRHFTTDFETAAMNNKHGLQFQVQVVDGDWELNQDPDHGFVLHTKSKHLGYNRMFALGEAVSAESWDNYEATIPFTVMGFDRAGFTPGTLSYGMGVITRWNGHQPGGAFEVPLHGIYPLDSAFTYRWYDLVGGESWELWVNDTNREIQGFQGPPIVPGDPYKMKVRVQTQADGSVQHKMKVWPLAEVEPEDWTHCQTSPANCPQTGSLAIFAHHVDLIVGDLTVTGL